MVLAESSRRDRAGIPHGGKACWPLRPIATFGGSALWALSSWPGPRARQHPTSYLLGHRGLKPSLVAVGGCVEITSQNHGVAL